MVVTPDWTIIGKTVLVAKDLDEFSRVPCVPAGNKDKGDIAACTSVCHPDDPARVGEVANR